jgi:ribosomal protein S18 acetylase RimI-like enzyme
MKKTNFHDAILTGEELYKLYRDGGPNGDVFKRIKYLIVSEMMRETHIAILDGKKVVADAGLQISPYDSGEIWIKFIAVDPEYHNMGLSKRLVERVFRYIEERNLKFVTSSYSEMGEKYLKPFIDNYILARNLSKKRSK